MPLQKTASPDSYWDTLHFNVRRRGIISGDQPHSTWKTYNLRVPHYMSFDNQASRVTVPTSESTLVFSPILHHATYYVPQSKYTYVDSLVVTHHFFTKCLSCLHQVLKGICKGRDTIHHQVCCPITIDVMKRIKKALSEQLHNLVFSTFICSSDFTNSINNWLYTWSTLVNKWCNYGQKTLQPIHQFCNHFLQSLCNVPR